MPLKVNVGISKKIGLPQYSSVGAACHLEVELASELLSSDLATFQRHVRNAYIACRQAVEDELAHHRAATQHGTADRSGESVAVAQHHARATANYNGDGTSFARVRRENTDRSEGAGPANAAGSQSNSAADAAVKLASQKQHGYIRRLASQIPGLRIRRLNAVALSMFGKPVAQLSSFDASSLIDALKAAKAGEIDVDVALEKAAA